MILNIHVEAFMTQMDDFLRDLTAKHPDILLRRDEPMALHTTFRIGGPAACMACPQNEEELIQLLLFARQREIPTLLLGGGSNLLVPDEGLRALVIKTKERMNAVELLNETTIRADSGVTMARLAQFAATAGLTGLEFAHGIPGTVGGGVYMNAGAYDGEMAQVVRSSSCVCAEGTLIHLHGKEHAFGYRHSVYMENENVITGAVFQLQVGETARIREKMDDLAARRRAKQPLEYPSAGSAFKRPQGAYAAALIDGCGLRGLQVGGAAVSEKHAGFIVNLGGATADDVKRLIAEVQKRVFEQTGYRLEPEIRIL